MAQRRMISTAIWEDENFGKLSPQARLLFIGLITHADDHGFIKANHPYLRSAIFVYDDISLSRIGELLNEISTALPNVHVYQVADNSYLHFVKWTDYQWIRGGREHDSKLPPCQTCGCHGVNQMSDKRLSKDSPNLREPNLTKGNLSKKRTKGNTP